MITLQQQLTQLIGSGIILWINHPELKTLNGNLTEVNPRHIAMVVDGKTYWIPYESIAAVRSI